MKNKIVLVILTIFVTGVCALPFYMQNINSQTIDIPQVPGTGNISITMPDRDIEYDVKLRFLSPTGTAHDWMTFDAVIIRDGVEEQIQVTTGNGKWEGDEGATVTPSTNDIKLNAGDKLIVYNIPVVDTYKDAADGWKEKELDYVADFEITGAIDADTEAIKCSPNYVKITTDTTINMSSYIGGKYKRETDDTLNSLYSDKIDALGNNMLSFLLNNYNIVSYNNAGATHITGPVVVQERVTKFGNDFFDYDSAVEAGNLTQSSGSLVISDYSREMPSYVGRIDHVNSSTDILLPYGWELKKEGFEDFVVPYLYTRENNLDIDTSSTVEKYIYGNSHITGANNYGQTQTYQNDDFVDFDALYENVIAASKDLAVEGSIEDLKIETVVISEPVEELIVEVGKSYVIEDASMLRKVKIKFESGYDFFENQYPYPTTINFTGETLRTVTTNGITHSIFPEVEVGTEGVVDANGDIIYDVVSTVGGETTAYSEKGNKFIWNLPNIVTSDDETENRLSMPAITTNFPGHLVAPQASVYFYDVEENADFKWLGGNWYGSVIAKNAYMGTTFLNMWPYEGMAQATTTINAEKTLEGAVLQDEQFTFELDYISSTSAASLHSTIEPIMGLDFPYELKNDADGNLNVPPISIIEAGVYLFSLKEIVDTTDTDYLYDQSQYQIKITVEKSNKKLLSTYEIYQTHNSEGVALTTPLEVDNIVFNNKVAQEDPVLFDFSFMKTNSNGDVLSGVQFEIQEVVSNLDHNFVTGSNPISETSGIDGFVNFTDLDASKVYKLTETVTNEGYLLPEGYWIVESDDLGNLTITEYDGAPKFENNTIVNFEVIGELPATGGSGTHMYYLIGVLLIFTGFILMKKEINYENKFN